MILGNDFFVKEHFLAPQMPEEKKALFKRSVSNVVVEISSHCNRSCTYCPVSQVDRATSNKILPESVFEKLIRELAEISYAGGVCLNLYNEPSSDRNLLLERIRFTRNLLPGSRIYFSTNGDYLDREYLKEMVDAGLSELYVTLHAPKGKPYHDGYSIGRLTEISVRLGKQVRITSFSPNQTIQGEMKLFGIRIYIFSTNYDVLGSDRAGAIKSLSAIAKARTAPCDRPFHDVTISYDGTIFPCCQMFADNSEHKSHFSIGNISDFDTIFDIYASDAMTGWRKSLLTFGEKPSPCDTCSEANCAGTTEEKAAREAVFNEHVPNDGTPVARPAAPVRSRIFKAFWK
jgi:radical SAM protein with 4Fe4S-binding SPASM domain